MEEWQRAHASLPTYPGGALLESGAADWPSRRGAKSQRLAQKMSNNVPISFS